MATHFQPSNYRSAPRARRTSRPLQLLINAVRRHALLPDNYNNGWDIVAETMTDEDIGDQLIQASLCSFPLHNTDDAIRAFEYDGRNTMLGLRNHFVGAVYLWRLTQAERTPKQGWDY